LNTYVTNEDSERERRGPTKQLSHNVDQFLGETVYKHLVRTLAKDEEHLVRTVDYIVGILVHDQVDTLQRIIDECIIPFDRRKRLSKHLKIAANYIKNQHKHELNKEKIHYALFVAEKEAKPKHYSVLGRNKLFRLCEERGIQIQKNSSTKLLIEHLETSENAETNANSTRHSARADYCTMKHDELYQLCQEHCIRVRESTPRLTLIARLKSFDSAALTDAAARVDSGINKESLGYKFLHWFMSEDLPCALHETINDPESNVNVERVKNAQSFVKEAHDKFWIYLGHTVRVVNQQGAFEEKEKELRQLCLEEKNSTLMRIMLEIDFKQKFEPMYQREKQNEAFGKQGISWHGI